MICSGSKRIARHAGPPVVGSRIHGAVPGAPTATRLSDEHVRIAGRRHRSFGKLQEADPGVEGDGPTTATHHDSPVTRNHPRLRRHAAAKGEQTKHLVVVPARTASLGGVVAKEPRYSSSDSRND